MCALEVAWQPREQHVEGPIATEVIDDKRPNSTLRKQPLPWDCCGLLRSWMTCIEQLALGRRDRGVICRIVRCEGEPEERDGEEPDCHEGG